MARGVGASKHARWRMRLKRYAESDLTVADFCLDEGISQASFYYWRKKLAHSGNGGQRETGSTGNFAAVRVVGSASVSVQLAGGTCLEIPTGDPEVLRLAIDTLARVDAERAGVSPC